MLRMEPPAWLQSLGILLVVAFAAWLLRLIHLRLVNSVHSQLRPLRVAARAVHVPLLALLWAYGIVAAIYVLVPPDAFALRRVLYAVGHGLGAGLGIWLLARVGRRVIGYLENWALTRSGLFDRYLVPLLARCLVVLAPVLLLLSITPLLALSEEAARAFRNVTALLLIAGMATVLIYLVNMGERILTDRFQVDVADNLRARRVHTQVAVLRKLINFVIILLALACMLMVFEKVRQLGASILASAGIAGVILGLAAQKVLGNLIAGVQIALTQPIRIDDAVVVEGEWGVVEELTLTYVVVRLWDLRRLVLPITYFVENPFQNWTRTNTGMLGAVLLYVDFSVPVDALRVEFERILKASPRWDGKVAALQVTDATERSMEVRLLVSAANANLFDLRCEVREQMISFVQAHYPQGLPRLRTEPAEADPSATARSY